MKFAPISQSAARDQHVCHKDAISRRLVSSANVMRSDGLILLSVSHVLVWWTESQICLLSENGWLIYQNAKKKNPPTCPYAWLALASQQSKPITCHNNGKASTELLKFLKEQQLKSLTKPSEIINIYITH